jgi:hypothetical protein
MLKKWFLSVSLVLASLSISSNSSSAQTLFVNGVLDTAAYAAFALSWDKTAMEKRLGSSFETLHPNATDTRVTVYKPTSTPRIGGYPRTNPYELGSSPTTDSNYWSDSGQVGYLADYPLTDAGLDRIQTLAYYDHVWATSPRLDYASGTPHSDPQTRDTYYLSLFGQYPKSPIGMERNFGMQQNEALVLYKGGYLGVAGTQTSRTSYERPYPGFVFPANKIPMGIAVTTENEFALVTIWDITAHKGQVAVLALEGKYLVYHTWPYMAMPNQGSWSSFKLLGYIDLPFATPTSISAASSGYWAGPSATGGRVLSQINLADDTQRALVYNGSWQTLVGTSGYAMVASVYENKVAFIDLKPLFGYIRESYLSSETSYAATIAARGPGDSQFPQTFSVRPSIKPTIAGTFSVNQPSAVLAGFRVGRWSTDYYKGYVASRDGNIHIFNTASLISRWTWEQKGALAETGSFFAGLNPVSMCFARHGIYQKTFPLLPIGSDGKQMLDLFNNDLHIACRGDRKITSFVTYRGTASNYMTITDKRLGDPVNISVACRGNILTVADFHGRKYISYRIGAINDTRTGVLYKCGATGTDAFECGGEVSVAGYPFLVGSSNVN